MLRIEKGPQGKSFFSEPSTTGIRESNLLGQFEKFLNGQKRNEVLKSESREKELERQRQLELENQRRLAREKALEEERQRVEIRRGKETCQMLIKEMKEKGLEEMAGQIRDKLWKNNYKARISSEWSTWPNVRIEKDGKEINTSRSGIKLSYSHPDTERRTWSDYDPCGSFGGSYTMLTTRKEELYFGIGFAGDGTRTRYGTDTSFSDGSEEIKKGTKIYFLSFINPNDRDICYINYNIPFTHPNADNEFVQKLAEVAGKTSPNIVIPDANRRVADHQREKREEREKLEKQIKALTKASDEI